MGGQPLGLQGDSTALVPRLGKALAPQLPTKQQAEALAS